MTRRKLAELTSGSDDVPVLSSHESRLQAFDGSVGRSRQLARHHLQVFALDTGLPADAGATIESLTGDEGSGAGVR